MDQIRCFGRIDVLKERAFPMLEMEPPATDDATRPEEDRGLPISGQLEGQPILIA